MYWRFADVTHLSKHETAINVSIVPPEQHQSQ